jgi:hypothetical protein
VPGSTGHHRFLSLGEIRVVRIGHCCGQFGDVPALEPGAIEFVRLCREVQDHLRFGDVVRLTNLSGNQNQPHNDADDLRDFAPIPLFISQASVVVLEGEGVIIRRDDATRVWIAEWAFHRCVN